MKENLLESFDKVRDFLPFYYNMKTASIACILQLMNVTLPFLK
jgi:hypothetical protein